ncbi:MAG: hypothetical protein KBF78_14120 [Fuscovulum sp.]|nr:hypothetical protein [Fuscovulum sp.]
MSSRPVTRGNRSAIADAAWAIALRLKEFGYAEIAVEMKIKGKRAAEIVRGWEAERAIVAVPAGTHRATRRRFQVVEDYVRLPGRTAEDNMWLAMRKLRSFSPSTIAAHATVGEIAVTPEAAAAYCRALHGADYLALARRAAPAMKREAIYRLAIETGPKAPLPGRVRALRDPNTGQIIVLEDRA